MTGFNFFSHGSQDLFPKMIETAKGKSASVASKATIIGNVGAIDKSFSLLQRDFTDRHWAAQSLDTLRNTSVVDSRESSRLYSCSRADVQNPALPVLHCLLDPIVDPPEQLPRTRRRSLLHPIR